MMIRTSSHSRWTFYAMAAVLLLASYLRIHDLNAQGLWGDEGWSIWLARGHSVRDLTMTMVNDHHGPEYSILLRLWGHLAGESVLGLRMITVLFSITSIALLYQLGKALFSPAAGVWAALIFTLMDKQVVLTQEVRDYPMIFLVMMVIAYFYVRWLHAPKGGRGFAFGFVLFSVVGLYLHYYCYMVNLAILVHALITLRDKTRWKHLIALNALITLAFSPWIMVVIYQFIGTPVNPFILTTHGMPFNKSTLEYLANESLGKPLALNGILMLIGGLVPMGRSPGPMSRVPREKRLSGALLAALWFGIPIWITVGLHTKYPLLTDRDISVILPAIALLAGHGLTAFENFGQTWLVALVVVNGLFSTSSFFVKPPWRALAADVAANYPGHEPVLVEVWGDHAALWYHLTLVLPKEDRDQIVSLYDYRKRYKDYFLPHIKAVLDQTDGFWIAYWGEEFPANQDSLNLIAQEGFVRTATLRYQHHGSPIFAFRYDRPSALQQVIARYGDSITLRKVALPETVRRGQAAHIQLWWSTEAPVGLDYSVSVFLLDGSGVLRVQHDSFPANNHAPTTSWAPGSYVFDGHTLQIPSHLPSGTYTVGVKLYTYWDGAILPTGDGAPYQVVGTVTVR